MDKKRMVLLTISLFMQSAWANNDDCKPHAWDTQFSPMQERNIVDDLSSLKKGEMPGINKAVRYLGRPNRVEKSDDSRIASWVYGQRRRHDFDDCRGTARIDYTVVYAILVLKQSHDSNVVCNVKEVTFISEKMRPDPYEERTGVVPQSLSVSSCEEFLAGQSRRE